jgi:hypothetical protein
LKHPEYVGTHEILEIHGVPRHRVIRFMRRGLWPPPIADLHCGLVFKGEPVARAVQRLRSSGQLERQST